MRAGCAEKFLIRRSRVTSDRGTALLELGVVLPLYVLILFSIIDLGQAARNHNVFEQVASNIGANILARIADLEPNSWYHNVQTGSNTGCSPTVDCPGHRLVHDLVNRMRTLYGFDIGVAEEFSSFDVRTRYVPFALGSTNTDTVFLEVYGVYNGVLPTLARTISVRVQYPYLYDDVPHGGFSPMPPKNVITLPGLTDDDRDELQEGMAEAADESNLIVAASNNDIVTSGGGGSRPGGGKGGMPPSKLRASKPAAVQRFQAIRPY